jgi:hypothetical protein
LRAMKREGVMGTDTMRRVPVTGMIENSGDLYMVEKGALDADLVRRIEVNDALSPI